MNAFHDVGSLVTVAAAGGVLAAVAAGWLTIRRAGVRRACDQTDPLTRLATRAGFMIRARQALAERAGDPHPAALLMLDLDRFERINSRYGRPVGDRVLAHFAKILQRCAAPEDLVARYAGEEFCVLVSRGGAGETMRVAQAICDEARNNPFVHGQERIGLSVSIGLAHYAAGGSIDTMLARADRYIYLAKSRGGDQVLDREPRLRSRAWTSAVPTGPVAAPDTHAVV